MNALQALLTRFLGQKKLFIPTVSFAVQDSGITDLRVSEYSWVVAEKSVAKAFADKAAVNAHKGRGGTKAIRCLDANPDYQDGQDLFVVPVRKMVTDNLIVTETRGIETTGLYGVTQDRALADRTMAELNRKNNIPASEGRLIEVKYLAPKL